MRKTNEDILKDTLYSLYHFSSPLNIFFKGDTQHLLCASVISLSFVDISLDLDKVDKPVFEIIKLRICKTIDFLRNNFPSRALLTSSVLLCREYKKSQINCNKVNRKINQSKFNLKYKNRILKKFRK